MRVRHVCVCVCVCVCVSVYLSICLWGRQVGHATTICMLVMSIFATVGVEMFGDQAPVRLVLSCRAVL